MVSSVVVDFSKIAFNTKSEGQPPYFKTGDRPRFKFLLNIFLRPASFSQKDPSTQHHADFIQFSKTRIKFDPGTFWISGFDPGARTDIQI